MRFRKSSRGGTYRKGAKNGSETRSSHATFTMAAFKLTPIEVLRAHGILEESLEKLTFLGSITPDILQHREELSQIVGEEISRIIQEQRQLEAKYEKLIAQRTVLKVRRKQ